MAKYNDLTQGKIEAFMNKVGGMDGLNDFLSGKTYIKPFIPFPTWKKVTLGLHKNLDAYLAAFTNEGCVINHGNYTQELLPNLGFTAAKAVTQISLVRISVEQLGFEDGATYEEILKAAKRERLHVCPVEVAFALRLQYRKTDTKHEQLEIAMKPATRLRRGSKIPCILELQGENSVSNTQVGENASSFSYAFEFIFCRY